MWAIRDSDGTETLHSIYPSWAVGLDHLSIIPYVPQARFDAVSADLAEAKELLVTAGKVAKRHLRVMKENSARMREVEAANNRYYGILQHYKLYGPLPEIDDSPIISVKV